MPNRSDPPVPERPDHPPPGRTWLATGKRVLMIFAIGYALLIVLLAWNETRLVYPGSPFPKGNWEPGFRFEERRFTSADGTPLVGWYLPAPDSVDPTTCRTVLICHGNAENVAEVCAYKGQRFGSELGAEVFVFDYRGFGKSEGSPHEQGVLEDAEAALKWICERTGKSAQEIILVGHSLGGGPAVHLAQQAGCKALILQRTYSSLPDAASCSYPFVPVHLIMRNRMDSIRRITDCPQPLFQSHGDADDLIPIELARRLFDAAPGPVKEFFAVEGMSHWDPLPDEYWDALAQFVDRIDNPGLSSDAGPDPPAGNSRHQSDAEGRAP